MLINIGAEFGTHLESNDIAKELVDILNKIPEDNYILDFKVKKKGKPLLNE